MNIARIDHFVLTVASIDATCAFYSRALGMQVITFGSGRKALAFGNQKINLHQRGQEFNPKAKVPTPGSADFCLISDVPIAEIVEHLKSIGVSIEEGPVARSGSLGPMTSIYIRDLDGNLVEISNYPQEK
ncbi:MAG TPA: VOC family protein [Phycisphaerae bacterium]|nr:VOC family protein [Phycisphaerae bacterium]